MDIDIEELRNWLNKQPSRREIAEESGYPLDSLNKFAQGQVAEPRLRNLGRLLALMERSKQKVKKAS